MRGRVVVTGMGATTSFGYGLEPLIAGMRAGLCPLSRIPESIAIKDMTCHIAGFVPDPPVKLPRDIRRSMSPMAVFAYFAACEALKQAGIENDDNMGICLGTTMGSPQEIGALFGEIGQTGSLSKARSMSFFKIMGHTAASSLAQALKLKRRTVNIVSACAAGLQSVGLAYETIAFGREEKMLCGGTEEYSILATATFEKLGAASHATTPDNASIPFDVRREGIVCSEGAGILFLETRDGALKRGAEILAEICGFATLSSHLSPAAPDPLTAAECMREALNDAGISAQDIQYVNAHATGTVDGDRSEGKAIGMVFGDSVPVSSLKCHLGHTMAASGAIETAASIHMLRSGEGLGFRSGFMPDPQCGNIKFLENGAPINPGYMLKNSFALGGIYASLVLRVGRKNI